MEPLGVCLVKGCAGDQALMELGLVLGGLEPWSPGPPSEHSLPQRLKDWQVCLELELGWVKGHPGESCVSVGGRLSGCL